MNEKKAKLKFNPNNFEVNNSLGIAYKNLGKTKDAEKAPVPPPESNPRAWAR